MHHVDHMIVATLVLIHRGEKSHESSLGLYRKKKTENNAQACVFLNGYFSLGVTNVHCVHCAYVHTPIVHLLLRYH